MPLADDTLNRLLQRAERAQTRASQRAIQEHLGHARSPYWKMSLAERDRAHERFRAAQSAGAVGLTWAKQGGDDRPLETVRVVDVARLASFLGAATHADVIEAAAGLLRPWRAKLRRVDEILDRWSAHKKVRGLGPEAAKDLSDALLVMQEASASPDEDLIVRVLSARLFKNSKRIESLVRHLDLLSAESIASPARHWDEVLSPLGLVKEPQPFLAAGQGVLQLQDDECCPVVHPFVGVSSKAISGFAGSPAWILTIENLTTFHLASRLDQAPEGLIIYTAGMPSPAWTRAYRSILASLPTSIPAYHWGDIDVGGFRIAAHVAARVEKGRAFRPWLMDQGSAPGAPEVDSSMAAEIRRWAIRAGWSDLATTPLFVRVEQEQIECTLPRGGV